MKKLFTVFTLLFVIQSNAFAQQISEELFLNTLIDQWHLDAAQAKFDNYFAITSEEFVFLGTAPGERWNKEEFSAFCKPYFDKGKRGILLHQIAIGCILKMEKWRGSMKIWIRGCAVVVVQAS